MYILKICKLEITNWLCKTGQKSKTQSAVFFPPSVIAARLISESLTKTVVKTANAPVFVKYTSGL